MPHANPNPDIDLAQISARNAHACNVITGFSSVLPALTDFWHSIQDALNDALTLSAEVTRLSAELNAARLESANLRAAMRAALAAHAEGEPDPLWYLRDELDAAESAPDASRRPK